MDSESFDPGHGLVFGSLSEECEPEGPEFVAMICGLAGVFDRRTEIKTRVFDLLKEAGETGCTVDEVAEVLGKKNTHMHAWFHSTGAKLNWIKKIAVRRYAFHDEIDSRI